MRLLTSNFTMKQDDLLDTYMSILYLAMSIATVFCGTANVASAAIISQDNVVTINPENVDRYGSADRYFNDQPTLQISSGDTFKGTIRLQGGGQFLPKRNINLHAEFYLSNHPNIRSTYDFTGLMHLIDDTGNNLTSSSFLTGDRASSPVSNLDITRIQIYQKKSLGCVLR